MEEHYNDSYLYGPGGLPLYLEENDSRTENQNLVSQGFSQTSKSHRNPYSRKAFVDHTNACFTRGSKTRHTRLNHTAMGAVISMLDCCL